MDFGRILDSWERREHGGADGGVDMGEALRRFPPPAEGEEREAQERESPGERLRRLKRLPPQAQLDLHGMTAAGAGKALQEFLRSSRQRGLHKVLVIHGKGNHSPGEPVLHKVVRTVLERSPHAGAFGPAPRQAGGRGATWVALR